MGELASPALIVVVLVLATVIFPAILTVRPILAVLEVGIMSKSPLISIAPEPKL